MQSVPFARRTLAVALAALCAESMAALPVYQATYLDRSTYWTDLNDYGQLVGNSSAGAVLWTPQGRNGVSGTTTQLGSWSAYGMNDLGAVVGVSGNNGLLWQPSSTNSGTGTVSAVFNGISTYSINNKSQIIGTHYSRTGGYLYDGTFNYDQYVTYLLNPGIAGYSVSPLGTSSGYSNSTRSSYNGIRAELNDQGQILVVNYNDYWAMFSCHDLMYCLGGNYIHDFQHSTKSFLLSTIENNGQYSIDPQPQTPVYSRHFSNQVETSSYDSTPYHSNQSVTSYFNNDGSVYYGEVLYSPDPSGLYSNSPQLLSNQIYSWIPNQPNSSQGSTSRITDGFLPVFQTDDFRIGFSALGTGTSLVIQDKTGGRETFEMLVTPQSDYEGYQVAPRRIYMGEAKVNSNGQILVDVRTGYYSDYGSEGYEFQQILLSPGGGNAESAVLPSKVQAQTGEPPVGEGPETAPIPVVTYEFTVILPPSPPERVSPRVFFDPDVAIGYEYEVLSEQVFASVLLPDIGDGRFRLLLWNGSEWVDSGNELTAGVEFDFLTNISSSGVKKFRIGGIETSANIDPQDPLGFATGLAFLGGGELRMTQTALAISVPVPEPTTYAMLLSGLGLLMVRRRSAYPRH